MECGKSLRTDTNVGDSDGVGDGHILEVPQSESVGMQDTSGTRLEDRKRNNEVGGKTNLLLVINGETVGRELFSKNVQSTLNILGPLVDDVEVGIGFNQASRGGTEGSYQVRLAHIQPRRFIVDLLQPM